MFKETFSEMDLIERKMQEIRDFLLSCQDIEEVIEKLKKVEDEELRKAVVYFLLFWMSLAGSIILDESEKSVIDNLFIGYVLGLGTAVDKGTVEKVISMIDGECDGIDIFIGMIRYAIGVLMEKREKVWKVLEEGKERVIN